MKEYVIMWPITKGKVPQFIFSELGNVKSLDGKSKVRLLELDKMSKKSFKSINDLSINSSGILFSDKAMDILKNYNVKGEFDAVGIRSKSFISAMKKLKEYEKKIDFNNPKQVDEWEDYLIQHEEDIEEEKNLNPFNFEIDATHFRASNEYNDLDDEGVGLVDLENSYYEDESWIEIEKLVLHKDKVEELKKEKIDLLMGDRSHFSGCYMISRRLLEAFEDANLTGYKWCEIEDWHADIKYED